MDKEQHRAAKARLVAQMRRVGPGKRQQQLLGCRSVSRQPTDCSKSCEYEVRPPYKMDDMVIPPNYVERHEPFSKPLVERLLPRRAQPFR